MSRRGFRSVVAGLVAVVLSWTISGTPAAGAETDDDTRDRAWVVSLVSTGTPSVRRAAEAAVLGSDDDVRAFVASGFEDALAADYRASAQVLASTDGSMLTKAAEAALAGTEAELRAFVDGGFRAAWEVDERMRVGRALESGGETVRRAAEAALAGDAQAWSAFLTEGLETAQVLDERVMAGKMVEGGPNAAGPALDAAAQQALRGTSDDVHEFLVRGQHVARARDAEMASIVGLTEQARQAGETTATEAAAARETSLRAVGAAEQAKAAAEVALAEARAAGGAADGASAAAGRAADAASAAEGAASEATAASRAALRAAQTAADGARRATAAASLTARAAASAQSAAAAARTDASKAAAAKVAAQAARDAAAQAAQLQELERQRDLALDQARAAADASVRASANADAAAVAADSASHQAGVSAAQAKRTRDAAAAARAQAGRAAEAAKRSLAFAESAAKASDEAFAFAKQAGEHAARAAVAADEAAAHAGVAAQAAAEATKHAEQATAASEVAVKAAVQADTVQKLAREADALRLEEAVDEGIADAQAAAAAEKGAATTGGELAGWDRALRWDTAEEDRVPAEVRTLLSEAGAEGASTRVVLDKGRRAALALMTTGGEWTKAAAAEALSGDEVVLRSWLTEGRGRAAAQDDRARVWHLVDTLPDGKEKIAAQAALDGDDAAVTAFLRTRAYPGKALADRIAVGRILASDPGPTVEAEAQKALAGTAQQIHEFLRSGLEKARTLDQRIEAGQILARGGPEVQAAAQVALAGTASHVSYFLSVGQYEAAQRDVEQAAHVQAVQSLVHQAQQYAETARADAAEARRVAAVARGAAAEASAAANQAAAAAHEAQRYADQAAQSATAAKASADQAAVSAQTAQGAAEQAQASAQQAARSALTASAAARRASADAAIAQHEKQSARQAADAAGADAAAANEAALDAEKSYTSWLTRQEVADRSTAPGSGGPDGQTAFDNHRYWNCLTSLEAAIGSPDMCVTGFKAFGEVMLDPGRCAAPSSRDSLGCQMYAEFKAFVGDDEELMLDVAQLALGLCGLIPAVGEVCDALDGAVSVYRGDWGGAGLSLLAMIPAAGQAAGTAKVTRLTNKLREYVDKIVDGLRSCRAPNSFVAGTRVLRADGSTVAIEDVQVGDYVLATGPVSGVTGRRDVTATTAGTGVRRLVDIAVDDDANPATPARIITATRDHRFWLPQLGRWVAAGSLVPGIALSTSAPAAAIPTVESVVPRTEVTTVYNLSVADLRTYHVVAGGAPILVHNESCPLVPHETAGGHAIARHVGRTDAELAARNIALSSTYASLEAAERVTGAVITANRGKIEDWLAGSTSTTLPLVGTMDAVDGRILVRETGQIVAPDAVTVVLQRNPSMPGGYHVLTSYPDLASR